MQFPASKQSSSMLITEHPSFEKIRPQDIKEDTQSPRIPPVLLLCPRSSQASTEEHFRLQNNDFLENHNLLFRVLQDTLQLCHAIGLLPAQGGCISNSAQEEGGISVATGSSASSGHSRCNGTLLLPRRTAERHYMGSAKQQTYQVSSQSAMLSALFSSGKATARAHRRWMEIQDTRNSSYLVVLAPQCIKQCHFSTSILHYGFKITDKASENFSY